MRTIALINQKGGTAKTTSTVNLAACLGELGKRVLVIDLDPQADASKWLGVSKDAGGKGLLEVFTEGRPLAPLARDTSAKGVHVVPSSSWLVGVERALASEVGSEFVFREAVAKLPASWDFVLVDCPPSVGLLVISSLAACREVIIPVETKTMPLDGVAAILQTIERVRERLNPALNITGVLPCRYDARLRLSVEVVDAIRDRFGEIVFKTAIRENVRLAEAPGHHKPITVYDPKSLGAEDYSAAAKELASRDPKGLQRPKRKPLSR